jgi:hypothetical protein
MTYKLKGVFLTMLKLRSAFGLLVIAMAFTSCIPNGPPPFQRGIRFHSYYDVTSTPPTLPIHLTSVPQTAVIVSRILNWGDMGFTQGPPSGVSGADQTFVGETNQFGISDHKNIRDNAVWTIQVDYSLVVPGCFRSASNFVIPQGGEQIFAICYLRG